MLPSKYHSKGYGTEILVALSKHCFESLGYHKLLGPPAYNNNSSINMLQKAGYKQEAILRDNWILEGNYIDTPLYTLLEKDLDKRKASEWH
jgi:ribosomal-protein-alanine N-acetyltransferase